jgi:hypothetical protein
MTSTSTPGTTMPPASAWTCEEESGAPLLDHVGKLGPLHFTQNGVQRYRQLLVRYSSTLRPLLVFEPARPELRPQALRVESLGAHRVSLSPAQLESSSTFDFPLFLVSQMLRPTCFEERLDLRSL